MSNDDRQLRIPHVPSTAHRVAPIDGATVTMLRDTLGTTISLTLTRMDGLPTMEILAGTMDQDRTGITVQGVGASTLEATLKKVQEFTAVLRPDRAMELAQVILSNLAQLSPDQRERYKLPKIEMANIPSNEGNDGDDT